ncbi:hypothetical protein [Pyxidicoccus sp. MSG2]|uniref:hypothetical protein n=1 Tax=Pyxidicoccus sp. MSG2 TaxID=2996790 RepID=UPI00226F60C3|nr:hypothetical protein [Pyxidicoccus sp. MSG2]MCY1019145.1 hypothetical protein [Pyxidicoccus sp. MSG2]
MQRYEPATLALAQEDLVVGPQHSARRFLRFHRGVTCARPRDGGGQPLGHHRLDQVVERVGFEDAHGLPDAGVKVAAYSAIRTFGFPQNMQPMFPAIHNGGTTVNGVYAPPSDFGVVKGDKPQGQAHGGRGRCTRAPSSGPR